MTLLATNIPVDIQCVLASTTRGTFEKVAGQVGYRLQVEFDGDGNFVRYLDPDTQNAWQGYSLGAGHCRAIAIPVITHLLRGGR
jgi:hypothetical protein